LLTKLSNSVARSSETLIRLRQLGSLLQYAATYATFGSVIREKLARRRLQDKRHTTHTVDGRTYVYHAAESRGRVAAKAVQRIVDWFCNGSVDEVLVGRVDHAMLDQRQLRMLADRIAKAKGGKK